MGSTWANKFLACCSYSAPLDFIFLKKIISEACERGTVPIRGGELQSVLTFTHTSESGAIQARAGLVSGLISGLGKLHLRLAELRVRAWIPIPHPTALGDKLGVDGQRRLHSRLAFHHLHNPFLDSNALLYIYFVMPQSARSRRQSQPLTAHAVTALGVTQPRLQVMNHSR